MTPDCIHHRTYKSVRNLFLREGCGKLSASASKALISNDVRRPPGSFRTIFQPGPLGWAACRSFSAGDRKMIGLARLGSVGPGRS